jgi:hypothetical protein
MATYATAGTDSLAFCRSKKNEAKPSDVEDELSDLPDGYGIHMYKNWANFENFFKHHTTKLTAGDIQNQFVVVYNLPNGAIEEYDPQCRIIGKRARLSYYDELNLGIFKLMPDPSHDLVANEFIVTLREIARFQMNVPREDVRLPGSTTYHGNNCSKQADTSIIPSSRSPLTDWPTLVVEAGLSETLPQLRRDARWWLENSRVSTGKVRIVILFSIQRQPKQIILEQWEMVRTQPLVTRSARSERPQCVHAITITPTAAQGAPLVLAFEKVFLRTPQPPEADITFDERFLCSLATDFL